MIVDIVETGKEYIFWIVSTITKFFVNSNELVLQKRCPFAAPKFFDS